MKQTDPTPHVPFPVSYWVEERLLLAGEYPGSLTPAAAEKKLQLLVEAGVTCIVNLCGLTDTNRRRETVVPYDTPLANVSQRLGLNVEHLRFPIPDLGIPRQGLMEEILDTVDARIASGRTVYVHCLGGKGRTGTVVGCYLMRHSKATRANVLETIKYLRRDESQRDRESPETGEQIAFVLSWQPGK